MNARQTFSVLALTLCATAYAQHDPQEALDKLVPAEGLSVSLFASEPQLVNPTSIDVDAQGRVWVCEATNYRLFNQTIDREEGDRIRVLEDTDGDGVCDSATTFYQDPSLQSPMGIAVLGDRVYVCQSPDLFYLEDTDGDGVADKKTVVLTGFKGVDNDHAIHGVTWGPDGKLYFSNGDKGLDVTDKSGNRVHVGRDGDEPYLAASVLRSDFEGEHLELLAHNIRNPYEPCVDPFGNVFISDNDDDGNEQCRINYVLTGGDYGYTPRRIGNKRLDAIHWNMDRAGTVPPMIKTGFGSPCGMMYYENGAIDKYTGTLLHADAGPRVIRSYRYQHEGAGYDAELDILLAAPEDSWFRPVDVCAAPDGSVFVADWYDPGVGGHRMADTARGRIYRLTTGDNAYTVPAFDVSTAEGALEAYASPNLARRYLAFEALKAMVSAKGESVIAPLLDSGDHEARAKGLWILAAAGKASDAATRAAKDDDIKIASMAFELDKATALAMLKDDDDAAVRRAALIALAGSGEVETVATLAAKLDPADRFYREAIGIASKGIEEDVFAKVWEADPKWDEVNAQIAWQLHPESVLTAAVAAAADDNNDEALRVTALRAIDAVGTQGAGQMLVAFVGSGLPAAVQEEAMYLLARDEGLAWSEVLADDAIDDRLRMALQDAEVSSLAKSFIRDTRRAAFLDAILQQAEMDVATQADRKQALAAARDVAPRAAKPQAQDAAERIAAIVEADESILRDGMSAMAALPFNVAQPYLDKVMASSDRYGVSQRRDALHLLGQSEGAQRKLLDRVEKGEIPQDLMLDVAEMLHRSRWGRIRNAAAKSIPRPADSEGNPLPPIEELLKRNGDPARGRVVYMNDQLAQCNRCHIVGGIGRNVGPDLSNIGQKLSRQALYESILNPSAAIAHEYEVYVLETEWEGDYVGFIQSESETHVDIIDAAGEVNRVAKPDIVDRRRNPLSLMPAGLAAAMTAEQLVDLVAYLETLK